MSERPESAKVLDVVVVEDEDRARQTLRTLLESDPRVRLVAETWGPEAPEVLGRADPDIVFLDIRMPGMDGFEVLEAWAPERPPALVFVTAYDRYALDAFDAAAADYLLKPFSDRRFREALDRAVERVRSREVTALGEALRRALAALGGGSLDPKDHAPMPDSPADPVRIVVRDGGRALLLDPADIDWLEADDVYVRVHAGSREHLVRESLTELARRLEPHGFVRIHRSAAVNLARVEELRHRSHGDYAVLLQGGVELTLSRTRRAELEARLGDTLS